MTNVNPSGEARFPGRARFTPIVGVNPARLPRPPPRCRRSPAARCPLQGSCESSRNCRRCPRTTISSRAYLDGPARDPRTGALPGEVERRADGATAGLQKLNERDRRVAAISNRRPAAGERQPRPNPLLNAAVRRRRAAAGSAILAGAGLFAAHDVALSFTRAGTGLSAISTVKVPSGRQPAARRARAVEAGGDAVVDRVGAGLDGGELPLEGLGLAGLEGAEGPGVGSRGVAALGALVEDPDRAVGVGEARVVDLWPNAAVPSPGLRGLGLDRHGDVRDGALAVGVAHADAHRRALGDRLLGRERRAGDLEPVGALGLVGVLATASAAARRRAGRRERARSARTAARGARHPAARTYHRPQRTAPVELAAYVSACYGCACVALLQVSITFTPQSTAGGARCAPATRGRAIGPKRRR